MQPVGNRAHFAQSRFGQQVQTLQRCPGGRRNGFQAAVQNFEV
jgi:hypothetical protein